jgi:hypothetical protein
MRRKKSLVSGTSYSTWNNNLEPFNTDNVKTVNKNLNWVLYYIYFTTKVITIIKILDCLSNKTVRLHVVITFPKKDLTF